MLFLLNLYFLKNESGSEREVIDNSKIGRKIKEELKMEKLKTSKKGDLTI